MNINILRVPTALLGATTLASMVAVAPASAQEVNRDVRPAHHSVAHHPAADHYGARRSGHVVRGEAGPRYAYGHRRDAGNAAGALIGGALAAGVATAAGAYDCAYGYPSAAYPGALCPAYGYYGDPGYAYGYGYPDDYDYDYGYGGPVVGYGYGHGYRHGFAHGDLWNHGTVGTGAVASFGGQHTGSFGGMGAGHFNGGAFHGGFAGGGAHFGGGGFGGGGHFGGGGGHFGGGHIP